MPTSVLKLVDLWASSLKLKATIGEWDVSGDDKGLPGTRHFTWEGLCYIHVIKWSVTSGPLRVRFRESSEPQLEPTPTQHVQAHGLHRLGNNFLISSLFLCLLSSDFLDCMEVTTLH